METSIASSPSIGKEEVFDPTYESNVYFEFLIGDWTVVQWKWKLTRKREPWML
ncbi:hypothetical protein RHGRI_031954 [Rhododendron griersonianum]|uniref:Uncharacterized protein n=1 Tax=Rhododendron griersonianum TaxID=479676 RepID=A0AAV6I9U0_9ERIC|nr:hypothetical protein RHGRI_031954 [Rhododendron griersonianum]